GERLAERVEERRDGHGLPQPTIIRLVLGFILPIGRHILTGIPKGIRPFNPDLFTLYGVLEPLEDTEFIILPVDPDLALVLFEDDVPPTGYHDAVERHCLFFREVWPL